MTLEEILQKYFGCKKPFLKRKRLCGYWTSGGDEGEPEYTSLTYAGAVAYGKLTSLIYDVGSLVGGDYRRDSNGLVELLDQIVREEE